MMLMMFYYFYSLSCLSPLWFTFGYPQVPSVFSFFSLSPFRVPPSSNVGFINVNVEKYLQRYFNIETGTLFVYDFY